MREYIEQNILSKVEKPLRYVGGEKNAVIKDWEQAKLKLAFAFPDTYEIGMSHLGLSIIYHLTNEQPEYLMERVFAPWHDMEEQLRAHDLPLYTVESFTPLNKFDGVGFTLQYEMSYTNILNMMDLGKIPLRQEERGNDNPLVFVGGPCAYNCEPLVDFIDFAILGEGEEVNLEIYKIMADHIEARGGKKDKEVLLQELVKVPGVYVPKFYDVAYNEDGTVKSVTPNNPDAPATIDKRYLKSMDNAFFPEEPIVPYLDVVHDRVMLEVLRGCSRGCRFCQAGMLYRPVREKTPEELKEQARKILDATGHNDVSLTSLSTSDYTCIDSLLKELIDEHEQRSVRISLPSLRLDSFSMDLAKEVQRVKRSSLTFAPEAGTQRLRDVINKGVTEENLMDVSRLAFENGWSKFKLYFMMGLPTETDADLEGIAELADKVIRIGDEIRRENGNNGPSPQVTISVACFVPKPFTPFEFEPQVRLDELRRRQKHLRQAIKNKRVKYNYHDGETGYMEAVFAKGDRRLGDVLYTAWKKGCKFDGWGEFFDVDWWLEAFEEVGLDPEWYAYRQVPYEEVLPWDHINPGVRKSYLISEHKKAVGEQVTPDCRLKNCTVCGVCQDFDVKLTLKGGMPGAIQN